MTLKLGAPNLPASVVNGAAAQGTPGLWLPPDWGTFWKAKRNAAGSGLARIAVVGDSQSRGFFSSNLNTKGWVALLTAALQAQYGDGGSGFQGVFDTDAVMASLGVGATPRAAYASQQVGVTGTWGSGNDVGPGTVNWYPNPPNANGNTTTFKVRGTAVTLFYGKANNTAAGITWTIDGVAQATIDSSGGTATTVPQSVTVSGLADAVHTVVVTAPNSANYTVLYGARGNKAAGVVVDNYSIYGRASAQFSSSSNGNPADWNGGKNTPCDLLIYCPAANDAAGGTGQDAWAANAGLFLKTIREVANPQADVLMMLPHIGNGDNASPQYPGISVRARGLAEAYGAALIDLWRLGRNSWAYWNALGYWSDGSGSGASGTNTVHPSDTGHAYIASQILPVLTAA